MAATAKQPADGDQGSHPGLPNCPPARTHLQKAQDHEHDQDRYLIDVRYDLCDALEILRSSVGHERAEAREAAYRTLRIWLEHRADGAQSEPEFLVYPLQFGDLKEDFCLPKLEQDQAALFFLKAIPVDLGLKLLFVAWTLTEVVELEKNLKDHCEVLHSVPTGASKYWDAPRRLLVSDVNVEKLVDLDGGELDLRHTYLPITDKANLAKHLIQKGSDAFYDTCTMRWESNLVLDGLSQDGHPTHFDMGPGSSLSDSKRAIAIQHYHSNVSLDASLLLSAV